jgi:hypothetical protein
MPRLAPVDDEDAVDAHALADPADGPVHDSQYRTARAPNTAANDPT